MFPTRNMTLVRTLPIFSYPQSMIEANLKLGMTLVQQHINNIDLTNVAMLLELLTDLGTDGGYGKIEGVHCLDFGGL